MEFVGACDVLRVLGAAKSAGWEEVGLGCARRYDSIANVRRKKRCSVLIQSRKKAILFSKPPLERLHKKD